MTGLSNPVAFSTDETATDGLQCRAGYSTLMHAIHRIHLILAIRRERRALARLDDAALRDIGISRAQARTESNRSLLDIPASRNPTRS